MSGTLKSANYRNVHTLGFVCWVSLDIMYLLSLNCNPDKTKRTAATSEDKVYENLISLYTFVYMSMPKFLRIPQQWQRGAIGGQNFRPCLSLL